MIDFGITDLTAYLIGTIIILVLPGPNSLYCLSVAASYGVRKGYQAVAGIFVGDTILILVTVLGVGGLLKLYPVLFTGIKMFGGLYLMYLGAKLFIGAYQTFRNRTLIRQTVRDKESPEAKKLLDKKLLEKKIPANQNFFYRALLLSLTNPKAILFFLSFFVQFVDPNYPHPLLSFFILAVILQVMSFSYQSVMVIAGKSLAYKFKQYPMISVVSMMLVGALFIGFAINLWMAQLT